MQIIEVECANCGAKMKYEQGSKHIVCNFCESEYVLQEENVSTGSNITQVFHMGVPVYCAFIPTGFNYNTFEDMDGVSSDSLKSVPLRVFNNEANIYFYPYAYYRDGTFSGHHIDGMTLTNFYKYVPIDQYVIRRVTEVFKGAQNVQLIERIDDPVLKEIAQAYMFTAANIVKDAVCEYGKFMYSFTQNGMTCHGYLSVVIAKNQGLSDSVNKQVKQPLSSASGMMDALKSMGKSIIGGGKWGRAFDIVLATTNSDLSVYDNIYDDFVKNISYAPGYEMLVEQERQAVQGIRIQGAMENQQRQFAAQNRLSQSIQQRNNIIMSGWENRRATQNRMMDKVSEGIRGVNSYTNTYGQKVEASVRYDHVYQDGNTYIASDQNINFGNIPGNWTELKRNY